MTKNVSGVGPTWRLVRFNGPGGLFGAERRDTHKLIISFAPAQILQVVTETVIEKTPRDVLERTPGAPAERRVIRKRTIRGPPARPFAAQELNFKMLLESLPAGTLR